MAIRYLIVDDKKFDISYLIKNNNSDKYILFLHGWGANKELMYRAFSNFLLNFNHIYIDLPGFGNSSNAYVLNTLDYASVISEFLKILNKKVSIIVGHSFGGKIATLLKPDILILLSSAGIIKPKNILVKFKITLAKIFRCLGIKTKIFRTKDVKNLSENMYETLKLVVDEDFSNIFSNFTNKTYIFWGKYDDITPLFLGERIHYLILNSHFYILDGDHFFFINNAENIDRIINGIK